MTLAAVKRREAVQGRKDIEAERLRHALDNMAHNKAYLHARDAAGGDRDGALLKAYQDRYHWYRKGWRGIPKQAIKERRAGDSFKELGTPPLCVDIEVAAVCDLACPFCFRQWIVTPDKIISETLFRKLIDQCAELGVPSIKLNWRGEPLLHPKLPEFVDYAKRNGVLEVLINTNATELDEKTARELIEAGLDIMIFSFDGGTPETYNKMRVGRFKKNTFEHVYGNIRRFAELRKEVGAVFPRTKIQMVLTEDTFEEQDSFFALFEDCVDDVSVKAYTERGGQLPDLDADTYRSIKPMMEANGLDHTVSYWRDIYGGIFVSKSRLPCEQPFQRLMVTYDGRVSMCCYDWGSEHVVGCVDEQAIKSGQRDYDAVKTSIDKDKRGFGEFMSEARMPQLHTAPPDKVQTLAEIWHGPEITHVRREHIEGRLEDIGICTMCPFKETYDWLKVN